jgi:hypothetical protein
MVRIEELMEYGTRRKVEAIATELGYPKAEEYPDEVLDEVKRRCKKRSVSAKAQAAAEEETYADSKADLQYVRQAAENRAAGILVALDSLTMMHCATRQFSDPYLQQAVDESQARLKDMMAGIASFYQPEVFLAPTPLITGGGNGESGLRPSLSGSEKPSNNNDVNVVAVES